jgi:hypothetical protein
MTRILSIDPSSAYSGWSLFDKGIITHAGFLNELEGATDGERYRDLCRKLEVIIERHKPNLMLIENYFFSSSYAFGTNLSVEIRGVLKLFCHNNKIEYYMVDPAKWKRIVTEAALINYQDKMFNRCKTIPSKANKCRKVLRNQYGKMKSKKLITILALEKLGLSCPKRIINPYSGKKINFPNDVSDSIGILIGYLIDNKIDYKFKNIKNFNFDFLIKNL